MPPQGNPGIPQRNPYQNGQGNPGGEEPVNSRKEAWDAQYRQNHWSNQPENRNGQSAVPQGNPEQRGAFSGMPQEAVEKPEEVEFVPYENAGMSEEQPVEKISVEPIIVENEEDAGILLEAAEEVLKKEEKDGKAAEGAAETLAEDKAEKAEEKETAEAAGETETINEE